MLFSSNPPNGRPSPAAHPAGLALSIFVLLLLLFYTHAIFVGAPYTGFFFNTADGRIEDVYVEAGSLQPGDILLRVGPVRWAEYASDGLQGFFEGARPGDRVEIAVDRGGTEQTILWRLPGFNSREFNERLFNIWGLAYIYWIFGVAAQLFVRPADVRRRLLITAGYLTAAWLIFGCLSSTRLLGSSILLRAVTWLILPIYLHLHWVFPRLLSSMPKPVWILLYAAGCVLSAAELVQALPRTLYALGLLLALAGSVLLQVAHFISRPEQRREVGLLAAAFVVALAPVIAFGSFVMAGRLPSAGPLTFISLPLLPLAYFYVIHRGRFRGLELRVNRFISLYAFLVLLGTFLLIPAAPLTRLSLPQEGWIFFIVVAALLTAFLSILLFPAFQAFVEKRLLGITLPYQNLREAYSARISASTSIPALLHLLEREMIPSLLVRQFAFLQVLNGEVITLSMKDLEAGQLPRTNDMDDLLKLAGKPHPTSLSNGESPYSWIHLVLPLRASGNLIGLWLFGRRDPDDIYPHAEVLLLQSLADQTAIALSNILHAEQLRRMYQLDIERYEKERLRLALDLHDSILNQLAVLRTNLDETRLPPKFHEAYDELTRRLREIVSDLRPPMLMYGLKPAIEELADNLMQRSGDSIKVMVEVGSGEERVPQNIEQHLFRIVQEACENAVRHAQAGTIRVTGQLAPERVDLTIADDGIGFDIREHMDLGVLLASNHFGLAGIVERVNLIGAQMQAHSAPNGGTRIQVIWKHKPD